MQHVLESNTGSQFGHDVSFGTYHLELKREKTKMCVKSLALCFKNMIVLRKSTHQKLPSWSQIVKEAKMVIYCSTSIQLDVDLLRTIKLSLIQLDVDHSLVGFLIALMNNSFNSKII